MKKFVCFLLVTIIIFSSILITKINKTYAYDKEIYNEVYKEYEEIVGDNTINTQNSLNNNINTSPANKPIRTFKNSTGTTYKTIAVIDIPKIKLSYPIINDYSEKNLNIAPTKFVGPEPNEVGNFVVVGHNNWNREFFSNLNKLEKGDTVTITDYNKNSLNYQVSDMYEINQDNFSCLDQNTNGNIELTLITCIKYKKNKRLVVKCVAI